MATAFFLMIFFTLVADHLPPDLTYNVLREPFKTDEGAFSMAPFIAETMMVSPVVIDDCEFRSKK